MSHVEFDPAVIHDHARQLYDEADGIVRNWAVMGALLGGVLGIAFSGTSGWAAGAAIIFGLGMGYVVGQDRGRQMRLDAQMVLLHAEVESNTRMWLTESRLAIRKLGDSVDRINRMMERQQLVTRVPVKGDPSSGAQPALLPPRAEPAPRVPVQAHNGPSDEDDEELAMQGLAFGAAASDAELPAEQEEPVSTEEAFYDEFSAAEALRTAVPSVAGALKAFVPDDEDGPTPGA